MMLNALLVGLGQIGVGYDLSPDAGDQVLTHARALAGHPRFSMVAGIDPDAGNRQRFERTYRVPVFARLADLPRGTRVDLAIIAAPTSLHEGVVAEVVEAVTPRTILCEKPLAADLAAAGRIVDLCRQRGIALFVNYIRRADPAVREIKRRFESAEIAGPVKGFAWYSKGFLHNGSHFADLLSYWLGPITGGRCLQAGATWGEDDRTPDVRLEFRDGEVLFAAVPPDEPTHHAIELVARNGRLRYDHGGRVVEWQATAPHPLLAGESRLGDVVERIPSELDRYQAHVLDHLLAATDAAVHSLCTGDQALLTQTAMMAAMDNTE